jgi:hypothetical protein
MKTYIYIPTLIAFLLTSCTSSLADVFTPTQVAVCIDQTDSTRQLRSDPRIEKLLRNLQVRPNFKVTLYGMMPDRISPVSVENAIAENFGVSPDGTFTGGDLQQTIDYLNSLEYSKVFIVTDGENNFGNLPTEIPSIPDPAKFYLIGVRRDLWQGYTQTGAQLFTLDQVDQLIYDIVTGHIR